MKHSWREYEHRHKAVCRRCGMIRLHIPIYARHVTQFERTGTYWQGATPPCDGNWPEGWLPKQRTGATT